jgi:WXG100 family type VII secretion target
VSGVSTQPEYAKTPHPQLFQYTWSGNPEALHALADRLTSHSAAVDDAHAELHNRLSTLHHSWRGTAADQFTSRLSQAIERLRQHSSSAQQVAKAVTTAATALDGAQNAMPAPPDAGEQFVASINDNPLTAAAAQIFTLGAANSVSANAQQDIQTKHTHASEVMTQLASAYAQAEAQLPQYQSTHTAAANHIPANAHVTHTTHSTTAATDLGIAAIADVPLGTTSPLTDRASSPEFAESAEFSDGTTLIADDAAADPSAMAAPAQRADGSTLSEMAMMPRGLVHDDEDGAQPNQVKNDTDDNGAWIAERHRDALPAGGLIR